MAIDKRTQEKASKSKWLEAAPVDEDKRMQMYRQMRDELLREESKAKTEAQK